MLLDYFEQVVLSERVLNAFRSHTAIGAASTAIAIAATKWLVFMISLLSVTGFAHWQRKFLRA